MKLFTPSTGAPSALTITLWDFSWYVRTGPGEPFEDLDAAFAQAVERGYNTVRICAMPFLLFGSGLDTTALELGPLGGGYGRATRWYDVAGSTTIDARAHLLELFRAARRHDVRIIASSWEFQQSPVFAADRAWFDTLAAVPPEDRPMRLAEAHADLVDLLVAEGLDDVLVFTELHNEVQIGHLTEGLAGSGADVVVALRERLEPAVDLFHDRHPGRLCSVNYGAVPVAAMRGIPENIDVLVVHPYVYGVLDDFVHQFGLRGPVEDFDDERARELLRPDAPGIAAWSVPAAAAWREQASIMCRPEVYVHDWCDPARVDAWLDERYPPHHLAMRQKLTLWMDVAADWAAAHGAGLVFGEGWVGYTPRDCTFEEGPRGAELCRFAALESKRVGAWGTVVCSNAAPQHPMWHDVALQRECNGLFTT
ncbi:cellulase-like family protein [Pengzhenrongella sp.]|jgi:hypothetical protein|uniref:cellulase-like family protein n=1 Tax=Pengzhenrongella sp. TaxID=2888820 RepID=UPI002F91D48A